MSRIKETLTLEDTFTFGKFFGMGIKEAIDRHPRQMLKMNNLGHFALNIEALTYLKDSLL